MSEYDIPCTICEAPAGTPCDCEYGETIAQYRTVVERLKAENEALKKEVASDKLRRVADYEPIFAALRLDYDRAILCIREMQRLARARNLGGLRAGRDGPDGVRGVSPESTSSEAGAGVGAAQAPSDSEA